MRLRKLRNSAIVATVNLLLVALALFGFLHPRFTTWALVLMRLTFLTLVVVAVLFVVDVWRRPTRLRAILALLLSLPVLFFYGLLSVWEGPLYIAAESGNPVRFTVQGAAGFHGFEVYGPDRRLAEWTSDDIGLIWGFTWNDHQSFPPMRQEFSYGLLPRGYDLKASNPAPVPSPPLDPQASYKLVVEPAMGTPEYYLLRGTSLEAYPSDRDMCWGASAVAGRPNIAVRVDCATRKALPMSPRGLDRLKAYQEGKLPYF